MSIVKYLFYLSFIFFIATSCVDKPCSSRVESYSKLCFNFKNSRRNKTGDFYVFSLDHSFRNEKRFCCRLIVDTKIVYEGNLINFQKGVFIENNIEPFKKNQHLIGFKLFDTEKKIKYSWGSDNLYFLHRDKVNYLKLKCVPKEESVSLVVYSE